DHRNTRKMVQMEADGKRVLNLFAYTGSFSCYAAVGGARSTTTVDLSKKYCAWAVRNLQHNNVHLGKQHRVVAQDCWQFLAKEKRSYDLIICDPPTFSNSKRMARASFSVNRDYPELLQTCLKRLARGGSIIFSTNSRGFRLETAVLPQNLRITEISQQTIPQDFRNKHIHRCWRIQ
ncbi:23S rRNA (guanine(2445)-N(2))-methyltransferase / 23S rRNA (guanine(2069)-N(7))-methyltransferase, partial [hydrothermal vent metagenome]